MDIVERTIRLSDGTTWNWKKDTVVVPDTEIDGVSLFDDGELFRIKHDYDTWRFPSGREDTRAEVVDPTRKWPFTRSFGLRQVPEQHPATQKIFQNKEVLSKTRWKWWDSNYKHEWAEWYVKNNPDNPNSTDAPFNKVAWAVHSNAQMYNGEESPDVPDGRFGEMSGVPNGMELLASAGNVVKKLVEFDDFIQIRTGKTSDVYTHPTFMQNPVMTHAMTVIQNERKQCPDCRGRVFVERERDHLWWEYCKDCSYRERTFRIYPNPKGHVQHPWVCDIPIYFRKDWLEAYPSLPMVITCQVSTLEIYDFPSIWLGNKIGEMNIGDKATVVKYAPRGSDDWGLLQSGGFIRLGWQGVGTSDPEKQSFKTTDWFMSTCPPAVGEPLEDYKEYLLRD